MNGDTPENLEKAMGPQESEPAVPENSQESVKRRKLLNFKHWTGVVIIGFFAALVIWGLLRFSIYLRERAGREASQNIQQQLQAPHLNDTFGGKTPEETFNMFLKALKKGNTELASRYFVFNKQDNWKETLDELKQKNLLDDFIDELIFYQKKWELVFNDGDEARFLYEVVTTEEEVIKLPNGQTGSFPPGTYKYETIFDRYPNGIWKISVI